MRRTSFSFDREGGVEAVELALVLPLLVGLLFGAIDIARMVAGYSAVRAAVAMGGRQAVGLQRPDWDAVKNVMGVSGGVTNETYPVSSGFSSWGANDQAPALWSGPGTQGDIQTYRDRATELNLLNIFRVEARGIAFGNTVLTETLGQVDYPCRGKPNCAYCFTLRNDATYFTTLFSVDAGGGNRQYSVNMLGLECRYDVPITSAVVGLGWLPQYIEVGARIYIPLNDYAGFVYDGGQR